MYSSLHTIFHCNVYKSSNGCVKKTGFKDRNDSMYHSHGLAMDKPSNCHRDVEKWRFPSIGGVYEFTFYFVKITETPYITLKLYRYYGKNMNKTLTNFKRVVDKKH